MAYIPRALEPTLRKASREFPAILLTGPRQSGKTTLLRHAFPTCRYASLEAPDIRAAALADPRGFLAAYEPPVIFDEIQHTPELLPYIKERIDAKRSARGQYLLAGSQNVLRSERVTETLAGRTAVLRLLPLSQQEHQPGIGLWPAMLRGAFPELAAEPDRDAALWHSSYIQTYLERDVRTLRQVGDLTTFQSFVRLLAARSGQLLSLSDLSRDLGVAVNTAKAWLSVLEATFQVMIVRPYFANTGKRLVKTPKVYFTDTGTLCYLVGLRDSGHASAGPMAGAIFETAVLGEILKSRLNRGEDAEVYFWRTSTGDEVDFLVNDGGRLTPIEVKLSATVRPVMADGIRKLRGLLKDRIGPGYVVHAGDSRLPLGDGVTALPFTAM
jgi:predicted AAA+ superfamily ATPase